RTAPYPDAIPSSASYFLLLSTSRPKPCPTRCQVYSTGVLISPPSISARRFSKPCRRTLENGRASGSAHTFNSAQAGAARAHKITAAAKAGTLRKREDIERPPF